MHTARLPSDAFTFSAPKSVEDRKPYLLKLKSSNLEWHDKFSYNIKIVKPFFEENCNSFFLNFLNLDVGRTPRVSGQNRTSAL